MMRGLASLPLAIRTGAAASIKRRVPSTFTDHTASHTASLTSQSAHPRRAHPRTRRPRRGARSDALRSPPRVPCQSRCAHRPRVPVLIRRCGRRRPQGRLALPSAYGISANVATAINRDDAIVLVHQRVNRGRADAARGTRHDGDTSHQPSLRKKSRRREHVGAVELARCSTCQGRAAPSRCRRAGCQGRSPRRFGPRQRAPRGRRVRS